ncbi:glycoside hydrolase family 85 protein [Neolentinus lepideus HHB14362 ss-1]|uniref:Glycoside hydrolase family 85 protein n=1 Tax=Neolentinus lepideus HHB14362 ss-1 TaxID=1314782 RepID=A0A165R2C5_9AGAM|nr:glycoside hydrolase family 85 protein [Neolentinus lepideus HHB14362 ss-1]
MPLRGSSHDTAVTGEAPYFESLAELDEWSLTPHMRKKLDGLIAYTPRAKVQGHFEKPRGQLLVCHDYKGGYTEKPSALAYTFNFWPLCSTFIYFAHYRVTIPTPGWINAAHRQGVKMLGTLIFEGDGEHDCLRLLVGRLPQSNTGPAVASGDNSLPVSMHYARLLADLAVERGFDGYLLNFECPLRGSVEQTQALCAWISMLQSELWEKVGPHAEVIWYDSVIITGQLRWQDRLNALNLPFFIPSTGFFTNYTWPPHFPSLTAQYFLGLDTSLLESEQSAGTTMVPKSLQSLFIGIDVWGRGSHGNGGFGCYKAINHIDPAYLGLSVALFGQAWTWESEQDKPGWNWDQWWAYERKLWVGPENRDEIVEVPEEPKRDPRPGVPPPPVCLHGPFQPMSDFFVRQPPPNPVHLGFYTSFCPGVGRAWFVQGVKVLQTQDGWTDIDKQTSLGDMLWPRPQLVWEHIELGEEVKLPEAKASVCMEDVWMGGSSLKLEVQCSGSESEDAAFRCVWVPIQSLAITPKQTYRAILVFKVDAPKGVDIDIGLSVKSLTGLVETAFDVTPASSQQNLAGGWTQIDIEIALPENGSQDILSAVGIVVGFACEDPSQHVDFSVYLGSLSVTPSRPFTHSQPKLRVLWADFEQTQGSNKDTLSGTLTWEVAVTFPSVRNVTITSPEDLRPAWTVKNAHSWKPDFSYFNVYAKLYRPNDAVLNPASSTFIGTNGLDGHARRLLIDPGLLEGLPDGLSSCRFYVQGVSNQGEVLPWEQCAFVDFTRSN